MQVRRDTHAPTALHVETPKGSKFIAYIRDGKVHAITQSKLVRNGDTSNTPISVDQPIGRKIVAAAEAFLAQA